MDDGPSTGNPDEETTWTWWWETPHHVHAVVRNGSAVPVLRIPSGEALRGFDARDDGHLEDPWTGEIVVRDGDEFLVTVRVPGPLRLDRSNYRS